MHLVLRSKKNKITRNAEACFACGKFNILVLIVIAMGACKARINRALLKMFGIYSPSTNIWMFSENPDKKTASRAGRKV